MGSVQVQLGEGLARGSPRSSAGKALPPPAPSPNIPPVLGRWVPREKVVWGEHEGLRAPLSPPPGLCPQTSCP